MIGYSPSMPEYFERKQAYSEDSFSKELFALVKVLKYNGYMAGGGGKKHFSQFIHFSLESPGYEEITSYQFSLLKFTIALTGNAHRISAVKTKQQATLRNLAGKWSPQAAALLSAQVLPPQISRSDYRNTVPPMQLQYFLSVL